MFMEDKDRAELKEFLNQILDTHTAQINGKFNVIEGKFNVIEVKLTNIETQTTKTNGRVNKLEDKVEVLQKDESNHVNNCPQAKRIAALEEQSNQNKGKELIIYKFITYGLSILAIVATIYAALHGGG